MASVSRPFVPKRSDPAKIRNEQHQIAEDWVNRQLTQMQGDRVTTPAKPVSPPSVPPLIRRRTRTNPTSSQGIVTGFQRNNSPV